MERKIIQFKISLDYIKPLIWRRFLVENSISLHELHEIIQIVMGWENAHLYSFTIDKQEYELSPDENPLFGMKPPPESTRKTRLKQLELGPRRKLHYTYDFGDNWQHTLVVEKVLKPNEEIAVPACMEGERNCPPEDCGSTFGYERILEAKRKKRKNEEDLELLEWADDYDSEAFDLEGINRKLAFMREANENEKRRKKEAKKKKAIKSKKKKNGGGRKKK